MPSTEALFATYHQPVLRYLSRVTGQVELARDLAQEVFLRVSRTSAPPATDVESRAWIFSIARNLAIDHHRQAIRRPEAPIEVAPVARAATQDVALEVNEALTGLGDTDRDVLLLKEIAGLSYAEIGAACDLTADAVRARIHRARLQLRESLTAPIAARRNHPLRRDGGDL